LNADTLQLKLQLSLEVRCPSG